MKLIIDTDPGQDDAIALLLACKSPRLEILALTTVCGNSTIQNTTRNARFLLEVFNRRDIPVFSGAAKPLARPLVQATVHGEQGLEGVTLKSAPWLTDNAPEEIIRLVERNKNEITLIALGPMTNIANAIRCNPGVMQHVKQIIAMGGALEVPGNMNGVSEFNLFVDPEAAQLVLASGIPLTFIPLDTCNNILLPLEVVGAIQEPNLRKLVTNMMLPYTERIQLDTGSPQAIVYDAAVSFYLLRPDLCNKDTETITIRANGAMRRTNNGYPITVVKDIASGDFLKLFLEVINA